MEHIVTELVHCQLLYDKADARDQLLGLGKSNTLDQGDIVLGESTFEDLVDLRGGLLAFQALLNHVGGELKLGKADKVGGNLFEDFLVPVDSFQFEHILNKVVTIGVFDESCQLVNDHVGELELLAESSFLKAALHDAAAALVSSNNLTELHAGIKDELGELFLDS